MNSWKTPSNAFIWAIGILILALVARVGWEMGGKVWGMF